MFLKSIIYILIRKYGLKSINDMIALHLYDQYISTGDLKLDLVSEAYDDINRRYDLKDIK